MPQPRTTPLREAEDVIHLFCCCEPFLGFCVTDLTGHVEECVSDGPACVVCYDFLGLPCPNCGYRSGPACSCGEREFN